MSVIIQLKSSSSKILHVLKPFLMSNISDKTFTFDIVTLDKNQPATHGQCHAQTRHTLCHINLGSDGNLRYNLTMGLQWTKLFIIGELWFIAL